MVIRSHVVLCALGLAAPLAAQQAKQPVAVIRFEGRCSRAPAWRVG